MMGLPRDPFRGMVLRNCLLKEPRCAGLALTSARQRAGGWIPCDGIDENCREPLAATHL